MSKELIENLLEYADIAEAGEKSHWAKAMREAAKYIKADLDKPLPEPDAFIVLDSAGDHVYSSPHKQFCHDHINDLLMRDIEVDDSFVVRGFYAEPQENKQLIDSLIATKPKFKPLSDSDIAKHFHGPILNLGTAIAFARAVLDEASKEEN
jgi:hypothetical protein